MTSTPDLAEQIAPVREPGAYWVRLHSSGRWRLADMEIDASGIEDWEVAGVRVRKYKRDLHEIGPRIPDPATLQQYGRAMAVVEAVRDYLRVLRGYNPAEQRLADALDALDAAAPETPTKKDDTP